ncbi:hypothetical protein WA171_001733, partial [Blastocystis sp. BT1]
MKRTLSNNTKQDKQACKVRNNNNERISEVLQYIRRKRKVVVLIGAGVSVDSGIPDFRSQNGFFSIIKDYLPSRYTAEDIFEYSVFLENPSLFYSSIKHILVDQAKPSLVHRWLQTLQEEEHNLQHIFTQNIDGLESCIPAPVTNLHGVLSTGHCLKCKKPVDSSLLMEAYKTGKVAYCKSCSGVIKPDILFYHEAVTEDALIRMKQEATSADLLLILGTSLSTSPVSDCISFFSNCDIISMNQTNIQIQNRDISPPLTVQLLGSFSSILCMDKQRAEKTLDTVITSKSIIVLHDGIVKKRKYLSEWTFL